MVGLTNFQNVITYGYYGSLVLGSVSLTYYLVPKLFGRTVKYSLLENLVFSGFKITYLFLLMNNFLIGVNSGYSWNAAANAGTPAIYGEGFNIVWNLVGVNYSANTFISLLLLGVSMLFLISILRAVSSGDITTVEEMVFSNE